MVGATLGAIVSSREREVILWERTAVSPFSRTCPNGGTGRRAYPTSTCRQRRAGSIPASGTPSPLDLTRPRTMHIVLSSCGVRVAGFGRQQNPRRQSARGFCICICSVHAILLGAWANECSCPENEACNSTTNTSNQNRLRHVSDAPGRECNEPHRAKRDCPAKHRGYHYPGQSKPS